MEDVAKDYATQKGGKDAGVCTGSALDLITGGEQRLGLFRMPWHYKTVNKS